LDFSQKSETATPLREVAVSELLNSTSGGRIYPQRTSGLTRPVANAKK
jgi:hypothetical protein